ncbi:hypothetical protein ACWYXK_25030 [Janthinobacterium lividum]|jgi:hypothetical protein|uniref:Uncharacterized protein n=1 Tax=Janthinobacterium lividum TaxID=29581 RepID=A0AAJ4T5V2_9BURK|nr:MULTISPECIES: hypothetical protein [Janthinobacterium]KAB0330723.1 hypothetical protein F3B38_02870 [Janthinobacterium lividum]MCC7700561.1 hypothetical protein [Janthinobacterium sp. EB271-G4-7A]OEZ51113.1 hypothetical protein JAB1_07600 [Janthinobacterium sp. MP5059B]PHV19113.1 hypothetical protein CSQ92_28085 [Janthinobacterium sp. BJB446]PHV46808.1 hypothetical protein CSQ91_27860 [Janthinobacterium sp. BJB301]
MQLNRKVAALCLAACASQPIAALAIPLNYHRQTAAQSAPEVRTRDLLLFGAGLILLAGRRRPEHDTWTILEQQ